MLLSDVYRDIYSRLSLDGDEHKIYQDDIIKAINDAIREARINYVKQGIVTPFTVTETLTTLTEDANYSFLVSDTLSQSLLDEIPEYITIVASTSFITTNEILDQAQTFSSGDIAFKGNVLYQAVTDINNINTFNLTFDPRKVRPYSTNNGLKYIQNDIVIEKSTGVYSRVTIDFIAENDIENLEQVYWKEIGRANTYTSHYPFSSLRDLKVFDSLQEPQAFTVKEKTVYATPSIKKLILSYVPKWTDITNLDATLSIPDFMVPAVKAKVIIILADKLNIETGIKDKMKETNE